MTRMPVLVVILFLAACGLGKDVSLDGLEFLSTSVTENGADRPLVPGTQIRLSFRDAQLGASAGCNSIGGSYRLDNGVLVFEGGSMTEMGCDEPRHAQDDWLSEFLASRPTVVAAGDQLTLTSGGTVVSLLNRKTADPDRPLVDTTWKVDSIVSGDTVSSVPDGAVATLEFAADGTVTINTGCNTGGGRYDATADGQLRFIDVVVTERACAGAAAQLEAAILPLLGAESLTYAIDAGRLDIMGGDQGISLTAG